MYREDKLRFVEYYFLREILRNIFVVPYAFQLIELVLLDCCR